jgi:hypothetical protein
MDLVLVVLVPPCSQQMSANNEVFIYDTVVVNLGHLSLLMLKLEYVIQKLIIFF